MMDADSFNEIAKQTLGFPEKRKWKAVERGEKFRACFGAPSGVVADMWNRIEPTIDESGAHPKHLLWALVFEGVLNRRYTLFNCWLAIYQDLP